MESQKVKFRFIIHALNITILSLLVITIAWLPFALESFYNEITSNALTMGSQYLITSSNNREYVNLEVLTKEIDFVNKKIKINVNGYHHCDVFCGKYKTRLHISNFFFKKENVKRLPYSIIIEVPESTTEFEKEVTLPISGEIFNYPFDKYRADISIAIERLKEGHSNFLNQRNSNITLLMNDKIPRLETLPPIIIKNLDIIATEYPSAIAFSSVHERPFYIKYIVSLLVIFLIATTAATILLTEFYQLITGGAGIILGIWGVRSLLLGDLPTDISILDIILTLIVIGTLISLVIKSVIYTNNIWRNTD